MRNPTPTATSPTRPGGPREARLTNELQARYCLQHCLTRNVMRCAISLLWVLIGNDRDRQTVFLNLHAESLCTGTTLGAEAL